MALAKLHEALGILRATYRGGRLVSRMASAVARYEIEEALSPTDETKARAKRRLGRNVLAGAGFSLEVDGAFPTNRAPRLVVANHRSAFDIAILLAIVDDPVLLSRGDIATWPVFGELATRGDTLFVDRADKSNGARAIRAMRRALADGRTLCVFPEGTTHAEPSVRPFQAGAFVAAHGLSAEVVPVGIAYADGLEFVQKSMRAHVEHVLRSPHLRVSVAIGEPIPIEGRRRDALVAESHDEVRRLFERATGMVRR